MAIGIIQGRFQFQRGTHKEWTDSDLILLDGELAIESDTSKIKIGNGRSLYKDLPYIEIGKIGVKDLTEEDLKKITGEKGEKGDPFTYEDLTAEQKLELRGEPGKDGYTPKKGVDYFDGKPGRKGDKGDPLRFEDLTNAQKEELKGEPGKDGNSPKVISSTTNAENNTVVKFDNGSSFIVDVSNKVEKIEGKTLSDNNFTNDEKQKLAKLSSSPANLATRIISTQQELDDMEDSWCFVKFENTTDLNNISYEPWLVYTVRGIDENSGTYLVQIAFSIMNINNVYVRSFYASWNDWHKINIE